MAAAIDFDMLATISSFAAVSVFGGILAVVARRYLSWRTHELRVARKHLELHFRAVDAILSDPAVGEKAKDLVVVFSRAVGRREIAKAIANDLRIGAVSQANPEAEKYVSEAFDEIRQLSYRTDMQKYFSQVFGSGYLAAVMRFPETEALLPEATLMASSVNDSSNRKMAATVVSSTHDRSPLLYAAPV